MTGWLLYNRNDAEINRWFIDSIISYAQECGLDIKLVVVDGVSSDVCGGEPDFIINRTRNAGYNSALHVEQVRCFNNYRTILVANNKLETYKLCNKLNIPVMQSKELGFDSMGKPDCVSYPCVLKTVDGHGGKEVFWIESENDIKSAVTGISEKRQLLTQKPASELGVDIRVYVMGGEIVACVRRESHNSFKSNYSLGGSAQLVSVNDEWRQIIAVIQKELETDFVGVDFILNNGKWVLNEIEDAVGSRMLYPLVNFDIAKMYVEYIKAKLK